MDPIRFLLRSEDLVAVLGRDITVRVVNISGSGCLVATASRIDEGATASLRVEFDGVEYADDVRVVRCTYVEGSSDYHLGMEFLWTSAPGERSMRRVIANLQGAGMGRTHGRESVGYARHGLADGRTTGRHSRS